MARPYALLMEVRVRPAGIECHAGMERPAGPLVEATARERFQPPLEELVPEAPAEHVAGDAAARADLEDVSDRRADDSCEQRPGRQPTGQHQVWPKRLDGGARLEPVHA